MNDSISVLKDVEKILRCSQEEDDVLQRSLRSISDLVVTMTRDGAARDQPMREIPARLGDRWSTLLLLLLRTGTYRHTVLRRLIIAICVEKKISQRMMILRLRGLERNGLVLRNVLGEPRTIVQYSLTPLGISLVAEIDHLMKWVRRHSEEIQHARRQFSTLSDNKINVQSLNV